MLTSVTKAEWKDKIMQSQIASVLERKLKNSDSGKENLSQTEINQTDLRDASGFPLRPYCRIESASPKDPFLFYIRTQDALDHISNHRVSDQNPWDDPESLKNLQDKEVPYKEVLQASENLPNIKGTLSIRQLEAERACETIIIHRKNVFNQQETGITFIPSNLNTESYTAIQSQMNPFRVNLDPKEVRFSPENPNTKFYPKQPMIEALQKAGWQKKQALNRNEPEHPKELILKNPPKDGKTHAESMENLLYGMDPITVKIDGSKKSIYLGQYISRPNVFIKAPHHIVLDGSKVTASIHSDQIPTQEKPRSRPAQSSGIGIGD